MLTTYKNLSVRVVYVDHPNEHYEYQGFLEINGVMFDSSYGHYLIDTVRMLETRFKYVLKVNSLDDF